MGDGPESKVGWSRMDPGGSWIGVSVRWIRIIRDHAGGGGSRIHLPVMEHRMATQPDAGSALATPPIQQLLEALDALFGLHPGFRPAHAKGACAPARSRRRRRPRADAGAPRVRPSTPVIVRFSDSAGVPTVPDNDPQLASPRGFAVRFYLADHVHTDIIGHSHDGFPVRTGEEFLEFLRGAASAGRASRKPSVRSSPAIPGPGSSSRPRNRSRPVSPGSRSSP